MAWGSISVPLKRDSEVGVIGGKDIVLARPLLTTTTRTFRWRSRTAADMRRPRSYTAVEIIGDNYAKSILYGQPFSIG